MNDAAKKLPIRPKVRHVKFLKEEETDREPAGDMAHPVTDAGDIGEEEAQEALRRTPAKMPTEEEVKTHNVSHLPFRDWCPDCVAGRAKDWPHKTWKEVEKLDPRKFIWIIVFREMQLVQNLQQYW